MKKLLTTYVIVGLLAFAVSFTFELIMFFSFSGNIFLSLALTMVLECSKLLLIVFHRFVEDKEYSIAENVNVMSSIFKSGLLFVSVLCSLAYFASSLDRPNLEIVRSADESRVTQNFDEKISAIQSQRQERLDTIRNEVKGKYSKRYHELDSRYLPEISKIENLRKREFDRVIGGVRKGPYWHEYDRQLQELKSEYKAEKDRLRADEDAELNLYIPGIENEFQKKLDSTMNNKESALEEISTNNYELDDRAKNKHIVSLINTLEYGLGISISYLSFAMLLSITTSLLLELAIYLAFNYVVMFYNSVINPTKHDSIYEQPNAFADNTNAADYEWAYEDPSQGAYSSHPGNENMAGPEIDPETFDFLKSLNNQFEASSGQPSPDDPENPCGQ
jgi:hypothetical protein